VLSQSQSYFHSEPDQFNQQHNHQYLHRQRQQSDQTLPSLSLKLQQPRQQERVDQPHQRRSIQPLFVPAPSYYFHRQQSSSSSMDQFIKHEHQTLADLQQTQQQHQQFTAVPGVPPHFNSYDPQGLTQIPSFDQGVDLNPFLSPSAQASNTLPPTTQQPTKKKNQYPCPVAKSYDCNEFFTTSGHAARHAKKHTGKKDAICPECKKAFTRKDNMEQHRRTHSSVRGQAKAAAAAGGGAATTEEKQAKRAKQAQKKVNNQANRESSLSATAAAAAAATVSIPQMNNLIPAQMPGMLAQGIPHGNHHNLASAPIASMDMGMAGMLDPRLMTGGPDMAFSADLAQFEQQLLLQNAANTFPRTEMHQSSYDGGMQQPHTPDSVLDETQDGSQQNGQGSPSVAPALDALALAASRQ